MYDPDYTLGETQELDEAEPNTEHDELIEGTASVLAALLDDADLSDAACYEFHYQADAAHRRRRDELVELLLPTVVSMQLNYATEVIARAAAETLTTPNPVDPVAWESEVHRVEQLVEEYKGLPHGAGMPGALVRLDTIERARKAWEQGEPAVIRNAYAELQGCE